MRSLAQLVTTIPSTAFNGWLNSVYNQNCPSCRDAVGHFCADKVQINATAFACSCDARSRRSCSWPMKASGR